MIISEFCKGRNVDAQAIRKYIQRHSEDFKGHTSKKGKEIILDDKAVELLDKRYPFPIEVSTGVSYEEHNETLKKLTETQNIVMALQEELRKQTVLVAQAEAKQLLLEDKERQLAELKAENEKLRHRTLWDYLLKR